MDDTITYQLDFEIIIFLNESSLPEVNPIGQPYRSALTCVGGVAVRWGYEVGLVCMFVCVCVGCVYMRG